MWAKLAKVDLFVAAAVAIILAVAALVGALFFVAHSADKTARLQEEAVVANGLNVRMAEFADAVLRSLEDPGHAEGFQIAFTIGSGGAFTQTYAESNAPAMQLVATASLPLIVSLRQLDANRAVTSDLSSAPVQASAAAHIGGLPYVVAATLIPRAPGRTHGPAAIAITAAPIDEAFLGILADRFLLDELELRPSAATEPDHAHIDMADANGAALDALQWRPHTPGAALLRSALPPVLVLIAALAMVGWALYRRGRQAASNLKASEARATHLAYHDALTGLPNRLLLADRLGRAVEDLRRRKTPFAVHCIDLDRFKDVNDSFGHAAGDELIRLAAEKINSACRTSDTIARLGGDEFAIVQIGATLDGAATLAERIVSLLGEPMDLSMGRVHIGASIGISLLNDTAPDPQECLRQADLALYRVKENGRGAYCMFEPEMDATVRFRRALQSDLHEALANDDLTLAYQPQVDGSGRIVGLEALVRWQHAERGALSPTAFIPIAEECGLIEQLGFFTLRRAFEDSARWPDLRIAINLSATQLRTKDFARKLADLVAATGVDPNRFELEITEGVLLGDDPITHATLNQIRDMGFSLALDDFGTGYSSLSYLQRYPIDKIKIDRSFVTNLGVDREADAVVGAIIRLARALNLSVIAEGVETDEQRQRLKRAGCHEAQGFLFGRPSPAAGIDELLAAQSDAVRARNAQDVA